MHPFPNQPGAALSLGQGLIFAGILPSSVEFGAAETTARALLRRGNYPFVFVELPGGTARRRVVLIADIQAALAAWRAAPGSQPAPHVKRGPGRPRKLTRAAALPAVQELGHE